MFSDPDKIEAFRDQVQRKIHDLLLEFADGNISREQFHAIYERYSGQLTLINMAASTGNPEIIDMLQSGPPTLAVREKYMGKALGIVIFHLPSGTFLETLGDFDARTEQYADTLNFFSTMIQAGKEVEPIVENIASRHWLLFTSGQYTTVVTLFQNEPSTLQMQEIERMHRDFEAANGPILDSDAVNPSFLAFPFIAFVQHKFQS